MEFLPREQIIDEMQQSLQSYLNEYNFDDIGIFEEEGQEERYYMGYTINKNGKTYIVHSPFQKNKAGELSPIAKEWTIETDEPHKKDQKGFHDLESALNHIH